MAAWVSGISPLLPIKPEKSSIAPLAKRGEWLPQATEHVGLIAASIDEGFAPHGLPTPWAHAVNFALALQDPGHPAHSNTVARWRGLVALLALSQWRGLDLRAIPLRATEASSLSKFAQALFSLAPRDTISPQLAWSQVAVFVLEGQTVGSTSPLTLVCSAAKPASVPASKVPWLTSSNEFGDPAGHISDIEVELLREWLLAARTALPGDERQGVVGWSAINRELSRFIDDVSRLPGRRIRGALRATAGIDRLLVTQPPIPPEWRDLSDLWLDTELASEHRVIVCPSGAEACDAVLGNLLVSDCRTVREVGEIGNVALRLPAETILLTASELFEPKLVQLKSAKLLGGFAHIDGAYDAGSKVHRLIPVRKTALRLLARSDLESNCSFDIDQEGKTRFNLKMRVRSNVDSTIRMVTVSRSFDPHEVVSIEDRPLFELWPNFRSAEWKVYFTFSRAYESIPMEVEFLPGRPSTPYSLSAKRLRSYSSTPGRLSGKSDDGLRMLCQHSHSPEVVVFTATKPSAASGMLLLQVPDDAPPRSAGVTWTVGIDFGTSGTNIYLRSGSKDYESAKFRFKDSVRNITDLGDDYRQHEGYSYFLPLANLDLAEGPILSLFRENVPFDAAAQVGSLRPIVDGHINFFELGSAVAAERDGVNNNLKWGDEREKQLSKAFIQQLLLHVSAEAVRARVETINWRFSYPCSFSKYDLAGFQSTWEESVRRCSELTGIRGVLLDAISESQAAAAYFSHKRQLRTRGSVCLDIGGGSTDIAIWQGDNTLRLISSVHFAGRKIFGSVLRRHIPLLQALNSDKSLDTVVAVLTEAASDEGIFFGALDAMLRERNSLLLEKLRECDTSGLRGFLDIVRVGIAGLVTYSAMLVEYAITRPGDEGFQREYPDLLLGGNGSRLVQWACDGSFTPDHPFVSGLKRLVADFLQLPYGDDLTGEFEVRLSGDPKREVAIGLVLQPSDGYYVSPPRDMRPVVIAGERFVIADVGGDFHEGTHGRLAVLTPELLVRGPRVSKEMESLRQMIDTCVELNLLERTVFSQINYKEIGEEVEQVLTQFRSFKGSADKIRLQPPFLIGLECLISRLSETLEPHVDAKRT